MKINILPDDVISKIAAGEVIERPASIVKELLENSLDAGSDRIEVVFEGGGLNLIEISDNGFGMTDSELKTAFKRHATSKIKTIDDLTTVSSLGFRGEALSSIASISKVNVISKSSDSDQAYSYTCSGALNESIKESSRSKGITFRVEDIFFNVPVRKKFRKSETTERKNIISVVETMALSRPDVAFRLKSSNKTLIDLYPESPKDRASALLGKEASAKFLKIDFENPFISLSGFLSSPEQGYSSRGKMHTFVNGRSVYSPVIMHAIDLGYKTFIQPSKHPACVVNIKIEPELIDVNVHPAKKEIRFTNPQGVHEILYRVIKDILTTSSPIFDAELAGADIEANDTIKKYQKNAHTYSETSKPYFHQTFAKSSNNDFQDLDLSKHTEFTFKPVSQVFSNEKKLVHPKGKIKAHFQWRFKYVIAQDSEGLLIIDQHTAWERINYEKIKKQYRDSEVIAQGSLIPEVMEFEASKSELINERIEELRKFGVYLENFGPNTFKLSAVPEPIGRQKDKASLRDMIDSILELYETSGKLPSKEELDDDILKLIACRSSIKAGEKMNTDEITLMINMLNDCDLPHRCPHGRPVIIRITEKELDSKFLR